MFGRTTKETVKTAVDLIVHTILTSAPRKFERSPFWILFSIEAVEFLKDVLSSLTVIFKTSISDKIFIFEGFGFASFRLRIDFNS